MEYNPQLNYIRDANMPVSNVSIDAIAAQYNFIFVKERLDESLVAFAITYNLGFADIVSVSAKVREGTYPKASEMPAEINDLVRSKTEQDLELWQLANILLDDRILKIKSHCTAGSGGGGGGVATYFETMLAAFRKIQVIVEEKCRDYKEWYETYNQTSLVSYWRDNGIAPRCRDHVVDQAIRAWRSE